jgi:peptide/nickel transport system substrate-binding protein
MSRPAPLRTRPALCRASTFATVLGLLLLVGPWLGFAQERTFVQRLIGEPDSLDPAKSSRVQADQVMWLLYDGLLQLSADGTRLEPALAEHWSLSPDGLTATFGLRRGVRFHDGTPLDAQAVKVSYERQYRREAPHYSASPPNAYERVLSGLIRDVSVVDPATVVIRLDYPRPQQFALVKIVSPTALSRAGPSLDRTPVGTGPFRLEAWEADRLSLAAVESWRGRPRVERVLFAVVPDTQAAMERLESGGFDLVPEVPPHLFERLAANPHVRLDKVGGLNLRFLGMQMDRPALRDRRVREAIVRAIDRERLAAYLGRGAMLPAHGPLPPACLGFEARLHQPAYDPSRARSLLAETAVPSPGLRLLYNASLELWSEVVQAVRADLRKVGFDVELVGVRDWQAFHAERKRAQHDLYFYGWSVSTPDPERFLFPLFHSESADNFGQFRDARVDALLEQARQPLGESRRLKSYQEAARLILAEIPAVFLFHQINYAAHHRRVSGLSLNLYGLPQDKLVGVDLH